MSKFGGTYQLEDDLEDDDQQDGIGLLHRAVLEGVVSPPQRGFEHHPPVAAAPPKGPVAG